MGIGNPRYSRLGSLRYNAADSFKQEPGTFVIVFISTKQLAGRRFCFASVRLRTAVNRRKLAGKSGRIQSSKKREKSIASSCSISAQYGVTGATSWRKLPIAIRK